jgi:nucleoside-diphosphate-sugar epimerase
MNVLVTGGAGFIGSNLVRTLQTTRPDTELLVVDDFRSGSFANLSEEGARAFAYRGAVVARPVATLYRPGRARSSAAARVQATTSST